MHGQRLALLIAVINLVLLLFLLVSRRSAPVTAVTPLVQTRTLELVDDRGQVRSRLNVEADGEVVLRLFDANGTIRVKLGAGEDGSGLLLADGATEPGVHMIARRVATDSRPITTSLRLRGADGHERVITP
jgi:hypothetical protein